MVSIHKVPVIVHLIIRVISSTFRFKDGYNSTIFILDKCFNASTLWNILFWPGFIVDLGTGKMFKWSDSIVNIELQPKELKEEKQPIAE